MLPPLTTALLVAASPLVLSRNVFSHFPRPDGNIVTGSLYASSTLSSSATNPAATSVSISENGPNIAKRFAVWSTTPEVTLQTRSFATSADLTTDWIIVVNEGATATEFSVASTIVGPPMSAGDGSTYSPSASSTTPQSPSSAIPRTGTFSVSSYVPARPTSESQSCTCASSSKPPHSKPKPTEPIQDAYQTAIGRLNGLGITGSRKPTVPSTTKPTFGGPRRPGLRTSPPFDVPQTNASSTTLGPKPFKLWRTGPLFPWLRNSSDIYISGSANSSTTAPPKACPVWYMYRGARRCAGSAWGARPSRNTTLPASNKHSAEVAQQRPSLRKPATSKSSPSAHATSSMASEAFSAPTAAKPKPLGTSIRSHVVPTNSLARELDLNLHCPYVRGRPRCGGRLSRFRTLEITSTPSSVSLAAPTPTGSAGIA